MNTPSQTVPGGPISPASATLRATLPWPTYPVFHPVADRSRVSVAIRFQPIERAAR